MFYFLVNKLLTSITDESRTMKIIIIGSMCYLILHAYLFSIAGENSDLIKRFRNYIYYMFLADAVITGTYVWLFSKSNNIDNESIDNDANDCEDENKVDDKGDDKPQQDMSAIYKKLLELKAKQ